MKIALLNKNSRVENVIEAPAGYEHPDFESVPLDGAVVSIGAYYDGERFINPKITASGDGTVINDGSDVATVTIVTEWPDPVPATLSVADLSESVEIPAGGSISREITTTDAAGSEIVMRVEPEDSEISGATHTIEVIAA